jgi:cephalosporin hydroxylase
MIQIDEKEGIVTFENKQHEIGSPEAFKIISDAWIRSGWDAKYVYSFAWMGRPIIQLPEDMVRTQEVIYTIQPDVIIETGVAHGGSLIFYASLCKAMGKGRIIGIDIEIRPHNRKAIEDHLLFPYITLIEGSSIDNDIVKEVETNISKGDTIMVLLDSNHTYDHVLAELRAYSKMVTVGSYIVATDGIMENVVGAPRTNPDWITNNPKKALEQFVKENDSFVIDEPAFPFNEGVITDRVTYWPSAFLKRVK